jgi:hypothetical protein
LFDNFGYSEDEELVGVVDTRIAAMAFVGEQFNVPSKSQRITRRFEEMDVTDRYIGH